MTKMAFKVRIVVEEDEGAGFYGTCPDLGCIHVFGETLEEAVSAARDAFESYLVMSLANGDPIPVGIVARQPERTPREPAFSRNSQEFVEDVRFAAV